MGESFIIRRKGQAAVAEVDCLEQKNEQKEEDKEEGGEMMVVCTKRGQKTDIDHDNHKTTDPASFKLAPS